MKPWWRRELTSRWRMRHCPYRHDSGPCKGSCRRSHGGPPNRGGSWTVNVDPFEIAPTVVTVGRWNALRDAWTEPS